MTKLLEVVVVDDEDEVVLDEELDELVVVVVDMDIVVELVLPPSWSALATSKDDGTLTVRSHQLMNRLYT